MTTLATVSAGTGATTDINDNFIATSQAGLFGRKASTTAGLVFGYYGGIWGGFIISDGTVTLTASSTNYVVVEVATGVVSTSTSTTNWNNTTAYVRLYRLTTSASAITNREDFRPIYGTASSGGGSGSTQGKQSIPITAGGIRPSASGGCATLATLASGANLPDITTLNFDATTEEYAQFAIPMPKKWNEGTITARFLWSHAATTTNFGVVWGIQAVAVSDDDTIAAAYGTAQTVTDTGGTTDDLYITSETSAMTVAGTPQAGDMVFFRVYRKAADASDTMAIDARLHGVVIFITTDADTDA